MFDSKPNLSHTAHLGKTAHLRILGWGKMARELVWLENFTFAAWGCSTCAWIFPNPGEAVSGKPQANVKEAFDKHECAKFPRIHGWKAVNWRKRPKNKKPGASSGLNSNDQKPNDQSTAPPQPPSLTSSLGGSIPAPTVCPKARLPNVFVPANAWSRRPRRSPHL